MMPLATSVTGLSHPVTVFYLIKNENRRRPSPHWHAKFVCSLDREFAIRFGLVLKRGLYHWVDGGRLALSRVPDFYSTDAADACYCIGGLTRAAGRTCTRHTLAIKCHQYLGNRRADHDSARIAKTMRKSVSERKRR
jgi:hypothetical protein